MLNVGWGQSINEGFESGLPTSYNSNLSNATLASGTWQVKDVIAGTTGVNSGSKSAQIRSATAAQIITPTITSGVGIITFYVTGSSASGAYQVNISTDNGANWSPASGSPFTIGTTKTLRTITVNNSSVNKIQIYRTGATVYIDDFTTTTFASASPTITSSGTLSAVNTTYGTASASPTSFNVSGTNMSAGILVTPPAGYEVCLTSNGTYTSTVTVGTSGTISSTPVYVRLAAATAVGSYSGNIVLSSTSATSVNVATVSSAVSAKPLTITGLSAANKDYDGNTTVSVSGTAAYSGLVNSESFSTVSTIGTVSWVFPSSSVGSYTLTQTNTYTAPSSNYTVTQPSLTASINVIVPTAPTIAGITAGSAQLSVAFTAPSSNGGASITNYEYSINNGSSFTAFSPAQTTTPLVISGLTNGTTYDVKIRAVNSAGSGTASNMIQGTPLAPASPTITVTPALFTSSFSTTYGTPSAVQTFSVSAAAIDQDVLVTAPTGFEISLTNNTGFASSLTLAQSAGEVASTTIYARLLTTAAAGSNYNSSVFTISVEGASDATITTSSTGNAVSAKALTITGLSVANKSYDGNTSAAVSGTAAYTGLANGETFAVVGSAMATFASANAANGIEVSVTGFSAPSTNYSISQPSFTANISEVNLTISGIAISNKVYNGTTAATITGTAAYQGLVNNESFAITGSPAAVFASVNVGTSISVTVTGYTAPSANYTLTQPTGLTADITQANQSITFNALTNKTTADVPFALTASTSSGLTVSYISSNTAVATVSGSTVTIVGAGTTTITASQSGNENFNAAASVSQNLVVTIAPVVLGAWQFGNPASVGSETTYNATTTAGNLNTITLTRGAGIASTALGRGFASNGWDANATKASAISNNEYFEFVISSITAYNFSISTLNATLRRSASNAPNAYIWKYSLDGVNFSDIGTDISFTSTADGVAQSQISLSGISALQNAKTVTFRLYAWGGTSAAATFSIGRFATGVTSNSLAIGGNVFADILPPTLTTDATANTVDNNIDISFTDDASWRSSITAVKIGATTLTPITDYAISAGNIQLLPSGGNSLLTTAGTKAITIVAPGYTNATLSQVINAGVPTSNSTATINSILASGATRTITCTAKDQYSNLVSGYTFTYDATLEAVNATTIESYSIDGSAITSSVSNASITSTTEANGVATFTVAVPSALDEADGLSIQVQLADGITPVGSAFTYYELPGQTITFNALNAVTYGDAAFTVSASGGASGNPVVFTSSNNAVVTCTGSNGSTITIIGVGTASISANQAGNAGYNAAAQVSQTLTVNQKALTISGITGVNRTYNGTITATFTGTPEYVGLVNGQSFSVSGTATAVFSDANTGAGKTITVTGYTAPSANYSLTQPTLTADITQAAQTISFSSLPNRVVGGVSYILGAVSATSATNPISYASSNTSVATIVGNTVTIVGAGSTTITASQAGSLNYSAATSVSQTQTIIALPVAAWDFFGQTSPTSFAATTFNTNLDATSSLSAITRGAGALVQATLPNNSFSTTGFQNDGISTSNTDYFQVTLKADAGYTLSLSEINANFDGTTSFYSTPGVTGVTSQYAYSLNGTDFTLIGSPLTSTSLKPAAVDLTGVSELQNVSANTTVTIRYYASGQTPSGGWRFSSPASGVPGLAIGGSLSCAIPSAPSAGNASRCEAGAVSISATPGAGETIDWYSAATGGTLLLSGNSSYTTASISSTTTYYAEARNTTTGCVSSSRTQVTATVNPTPAITAMTASLCSGSSFSVTPANVTNGTVPSGTTYTWAAPTTANIQGLLAGSAASSISGTLFNTTNTAINAVYTVTPTAGTCSGTPFTVTVTVNALPVVSAATPAAVCAGSDVTLNGQGASTYVWSNGVTDGEAFFPTTTAYYSVTGTNTSTGCSNTGGVFVTVNASPTALVLTGTDCVPTVESLGTITSSTSTTGVTYQLYNADDVAEGATKQGTGSALLWSGVPVGNGYYVIGTGTNLCTSQSIIGVGVIYVEGNSAAYTYYIDNDGDASYSTLPTIGCTLPAVYSLTVGTDCNDNNSAIRPGATEICGDGIDNDCSGSDAFASLYRSVGSGDWSTPSTWESSCDNSIWSLAPLAPTGDNYSTANPYLITVQGDHTVTVNTTSTTNCAKAGSLTINGTVSVTGKLTVVNALVNNGTLTINNGGSFVQNSTTTANSGNGTFNVNMTLSGSTNAAGTAANGRYWFIGSPMNNTVAGTFYDVQGLARLWQYNGSNNSWPSVVSTTLSSNNALKLVPGIGYLFRAGVSKSFTFTGGTSEFNNNITTSLLPASAATGYLPVNGYSNSTGFKFVSNPYPSHVDWHLVTRTGLNVSYWIRTADNTNYESYNLSSGLSTNNISGQTTRFIPPMQGFYVYSFNTTPTLRIDNTDRVHSGNVLHTPEFNQVVRLNLNDGKTTDETVVYENENASNGLEDYDTYKMFDTQHHQLYIMEGIKELSMDGLKDATAKQKVDMGIQITAAGTYTINATELGVEEDVVLEDKFTHTFQDMKRNSAYTFESNAGTYNNRFVLHFTLNPQTETELETVTVGETEQESEGVQVYTTTGQQVKVWVTNTAEFQNATVKVYDAIGNLIERKNMTSNELYLNLDIASGIYVVEVTGANKTFTKKVFITK